MSSPENLHRISAHFRCEVSSVCHLDETVQPPVLHTADCSYVVCTAYSDPNSCFVTTASNSSRFQHKISQWNLLSTDTLTQTQLSSHITYLKKVPICEHTRFIYSNTVGVSRLQLLHVYENYYSSNVYLHIASTLM